MLANDFIDVYVALRIEALQTTEGEITPEGRDRVLSGRGVQADDLLQFVEAYGPDPALMQVVWDSVEVRFHRARDSVNNGEPDESSDSLP